jgi:hypothetical protein
MTRSTTPCRLAFAWALGCAPACHPTVSPAPPEPAPSPPPAAPVQVEAPHERKPEDLVATVDGVAIREADVDRLVRVASINPGVPPPPREVLVLQLVERQLIARQAEVLRITATQDEIDRAVLSVAENVGLTTEQLRVAVDETTKVSWEEYRQELAAQLLELRLVMTVAPWTSGGGWGSPAAPLDEASIAATRARVVGCLRARAEVTVEDVSVELPENPFAIAATLAGVRFVGDPGVPAVELEAAAKATAAGQPLCASLVAAEVAMTQVYLERGYLDGRVWIAWPETPAAATLEVEAVPGPRHVVGEIRLDQSAVPKARRLKEKELRRRIAAVGKRGDVASVSRLQGITDVVNEAFRAAKVEPVSVVVERKPEGEEMRVDLVFRVGEDEA